jgi:hypothetical protein
MLDILFSIIFKLEISIRIFSKLSFKIRLGINKMEEVQANCGFQFQI